MKSFALSISNALDAEEAVKRMEYISSMGREFPHLEGVLVRDDIRSAEKLREIVEIVTGSWDGIVNVESAVCDNLVRIADVAQPERTYLCTSDIDKQHELHHLWRDRGFGAIIRGGDVQSLMDSVESANGIDSLIMPECMNMKDALENFTDLKRLHKDHGIEGAGRVSCIKVWSGEYAMAIATVAVSRGCSWMFFDNLERDGCSIVNTLCRIQQPDRF